MPSTILIQSRKTGDPFIIAIICPHGCFRNLTNCGKGRHCKNAESHLPYMIVCNTVLQMINVFIIEFIPDIPDII